MKVTATAAGNVISAS